MFRTRVQGKLIKGPLPVSSGGPYIGPRGGKWADPDFTIPWHEGSAHPGTAEVPETDKPQTSDATTPEALTAKLGEELRDSLGVDKPEFKQGILGKIKDFIKYQGKTEFRNNLNMFRYIGSIFSGGKIPMTPEERKASLAYMAHWAYSMVPAGAGGLGAAIKIGAAKAVAAAALPSVMAVPLGVIGAYLFGSKVLYPYVLSPVMKKIMQSKSVGEKIDPEVERYLEGYENVISPEKQEKISFVKSEADQGGEFNPEALEKMTPLLATLIQEIMKGIVDKVSTGDFDAPVRDKISEIMDAHMDDSQEAPVSKGMTLVAVEVSTGFRTFVPAVEARFSTLIKGKAHRYVKREPTGKPKPKYRYWYKIPSKTALVHDEKLHVGSKFVFTTEHEGTEVKGHYEVLSGPDDSGKYKIKHDETGGILHLTAKDMRRMIHKQQRPQIVAHAKKLFETYEAALKYGTDKQKDARKKDLMDFAGAYFTDARLSAMQRKITAVEEKHAPKAPGFRSPDSPYPRGVPTEFKLVEKPGSKQIGRGGFGRVYFDKGPPPAAVKYGEVEKKEYEYGKELGSVGITPRVFNFEPSPGEGQGPAKLAMEYLEGYKTQNWWENEEWNPYESDDRPKLAKMEADILRAIIKMGSRGFAHFDLHDENVMINDAGDVKIIDLGQMEKSFKNVALELVQQFRMRNRFTEGFDTNRVMKSKVRRAFNNFASETGTWRIMQMDESECERAVKKFYQKVESALDSGGL